MHKHIILLSALMVCGFSHDLESLIGTPMEQCINCICYAKTGRWDMDLCGRRFLTLAYWRQSGSLTTSSSWRPLVALRDCRADVNCVLHSVKRYTEQYGELDCNMDGHFDCRDRFAIQHFKSACVNRRIPPAIFNRFQSCSPNVPRGGRTNQDVDVVVEQNVDWGTDEIEQDVDVDATQTSQGNGNANQKVKVTVHQNAFL